MNPDTLKKILFHSYTIEAGKPMMMNGREVVCSDVRMWDGVVYVSFKDGIQEYAAAVAPPMDFAGDPSMVAIVRPSDRLERSTILSEIVPR